MIGFNGVSVASAPNHPFFYQRNVDPEAPGAFVLTTGFNPDLTNMGQLGTYYIEAWLDGARVAYTPLTLRRRG